ncbi:MAG: right-handed parallel beta-helix repeat-containing protein [Candidatus Micrarchaeia archaeon]
MSEPSTPQQDNNPGTADATQRPPLESFIPNTPNANNFNTASQGPQAGPSPSPQAGPKPTAPKSGSHMPIIFAIAIIVIVIAAAAAFMLSSHSKTTSSTTSILTTTVKQPTMAEITSCMDIKSPGRYYLTKNLSVSLSSGACINITSSNVELIGNSNMIKGSGPFVGIPPFTYGIEASNVRNVSITGFNITQFSYGVYFENVQDSSLRASNITKNTMSNIYLSNSSSNIFADDYAMLAASKEGGVNINGGGDNIFMNDTVSNNAYQGFVVNSTGNRFMNDTLTNNPNDFICNGVAGFSSSNLFSNTACKRSSGCSFAQCSVSNVPFNLSSIKLSNSISTCGAIIAPGRYTLDSNLYENEYLNMSNPLSKSVACINILAPDVVLNCNSHRISNGGYGILLSGNFNTSISNCTAYNNTYGLYINGTFYPRISNVTLANNTYGMYVSNMNSGTAMYTKAAGNKYGMFINNTNGFTLNNFNYSDNGYGIYENTGGSDIFNNGAVLGNKYSDLYCTAASYNVTPSLFQGVSCGLTDCSWGTSCARHALPPISMYPIDSCMNITLSGTYGLTSNMQGTPGCINIKTSNVSLECNGKSIVGTAGGSAIVISNQSNIDISNCRISRFGTGFYVSNSSYITIQNSNISSASYGILLNNVSYSKMLDDNASMFTNAGFMLKKVYNSVVSRDIAMNGFANASGFYISNSSKNLITFNNATANIFYGFVISNSRGNNVFNNTATSNLKSDYYCSPDSSGLYAESGGVNFGNTKVDCKWLVELNSLNLVPTCLSISSSSTLVLSQDMLYPYDNICFDVYNTKTSSANGTVINCNGHTMLASNGGTLVNVANASGVEVENCYIKGFTTPITARGGSITALNNTIVNSNVSIAITNSSYPKVMKNVMLNSSYGAILVNSKYGTIENNFAADANISYEIAGGSGFTVSNNKALYGNIGMYIINSTTNIFQNNTLEDMGRYGIACTGYATNNTSLNKDFGKNACSSNYGCYWLSSSPLCSPS